MRTIGKISDEELELAYSKKRSHASIRPEYGRGSKGPRRRISWRVSACRLVQLET